MSPKSVPLARKNLNNPQIKSYTDAIRLGQKNYHVLAGDKGWVVKQIGAAQAAHVFPTKIQAVKSARLLASKQKSSLFIHGRDGLIQERKSFNTEKS